MAHVDVHVDVHGHVDVDVDVDVGADVNVDGSSSAVGVRQEAHAAIRQARLWPGNYRYVLHLDVQRYFPSIDHGILLRHLKRDLRCPRTLEVCRLILEAGLQGISSHRVHFPEDDLFAPQDRAVGLPIGNLTSQHFANRYLSPVGFVAWKP